MLDRLKDALRVFKLFIFFFSIIIICLLIIIIIIYLFVKELLVLRVKSL